MNDNGETGYAVNHIPAGAFKPTTDADHLLIARSLLEAANTEMSWCGGHRSSMLQVEIDLFLAAIDERVIAGLEARRGAAKAIRRVREARIRAGARAKAVRRARTGA